MKKLALLLVTFALLILAACGEADSSRSDAELIAEGWTELL